MKLCKNSNCTNPVFSHLYCKNHQYLRIDSSYVKKQKIAREKKYNHEKKITRNIDFGFRGELEMFEHIWLTRSHVCQFTGENLDKFYGTDLWYSCFMHILPKGKFSLFKLNANNVILGFPYFHNIVDQGSSDDMAKHPTWNFNLWYKFVQETKEEYVKFQRDNLLA